MHQFIYARDDNIIIVLAFRNVRRTAQYVYGATCAYPGSPKKLIIISS